MTQQSVDELWKSAGSISSELLKSSRDLRKEVEDDRRDYGEKRILCVGFLEGRMVLVGYTPRGVARHDFR